MNFQFEHLEITDLTGQRAVFSTLRIFIELTGCHSTALFLSEALYWQRRAFERGDSEFYMPLDSEGKGPSWADYLLSRSHVDSARSLLEPLGILKTRVGSRNGRKTTFYQLDPGALDQAIGEFKKTGQKLRRILTVPAWHTWRKEGHGRPLADSEKPSITISMIKGAAISRPVEKKRTTSKTSKQSSPAQVAIPLVPTQQTVPVASAPPSRAVKTFEFPISSSEWKLMDRIDRLMATEQAKKIWENSPYLTACMLGYEEVVKTTSDRDFNTRRQFAPELIEHSLNSLKRYGDSDKCAAINWIVAACNSLDETDPSRVNVGTQRLDSLMEVLFRKKLEQASSVSQSVFQLELPEESINLTEIQKLGDLEIIALPLSELPYSHDVRLATKLRLKRVGDGSMRARKPGEPIERRFHHLYEKNNSRSGIGIELSAELPSEKALGVA